METVKGKPISQLPLCGVFAVAFIAGKPVEEVFELFKDRYGKSNHWQGRVSRRACLAVLEQIGIKFSPVQQGDWKNCSLAKWIDWYTAKGKTYFVETSSHFQVVRDGIVHDQCGSLPIGKVKGRLSRVKRALLIH